MKSLLSIDLILLFLHSTAQPDTTLVKDCFNKYKEAVLNDKGAAAYSVLDKKTIVHYNELGNTGFKRLVEQSGMSENEAIFSMLESVSGTKPSQSIWNPLIK